MLITQLLIGVAAVGEPPLPVAPPPRAVEVQPDLPLGLADWTPRPATGKAEPWEKATDKDWIDGRFRLMDTGPFLNCSMDYPFGKGKERVYKKVEIIGVAGDFEGAVQAAVQRARQSLEGLSWFEVQDIRGHIGEDGKITEYQVVLKVSFELK